MDWVCALAAEKFELSTWSVMHLMPLSARPIVTCKPFNI